MWVPGGLCQLQGGDALLVGQGHGQQASWLTQQQLSQTPQAPAHRQVEDRLSGGAIWGRRGERGGRGRVGKWGGGREKKRKLVGGLKGDFERCVRMRKTERNNKTVSVLLFLALVRNFN